MRTLHILLATVLAYALCAQSISTTDLHSFSPDLLVVESGTEIAITVGTGHTMTETTEATWNANDNTPNGGFHFDPGTHALTLTLPGTYYFVCQPHAFMGMKGRIIVESSTGMGGHTSGPPLLLHPSPASNELRVGPGAAGPMVVILYDVQGREVLRHTVQGTGTLDLGRLPAGTYAASVTDADGGMLARQRIVIAR